MSRGVSIVIALLLVGAIGFGTWTLLSPPSSEDGKTVIRIGYLPITDHLTVIAKARSSFPHVNLRLVKFGSWPDVAEALRAGAIDGAYLLAPLGLSLRKKGAPIKAILLGHRNGSVLIVKSSAEIGRPEDLRDHKIAIPSRFSTHNILIRKLLGDHGLNPDLDVKLVEMSPPEMVNALSTGAIDAFIVAEPFGGQAEMQKIGKILVLSKDIWAGHICCVLHASEKLIDEHPDAVQELVNGIVAAARFIEEEPEKAAVMSKQFLGQKPEVIEHVLLKPRGRVTFSDLTPRRADFEATQGYLIQYGIFSDKVDLGRYIDDRFARKAYGDR